MKILCHERRQTAHAVQRTLDFILPRLRWPNAGVSHKSRYAIDAQLPFKFVRFFGHFRFVTEEKPISIIAPDAPDRLRWNIFGHARARLCSKRTISREILCCASRMAGPLDNA